jgi:UDP-N-acetylglucosamine--N-acetylmuramyl-(pentapeptide) pyrophosphoryl-undecaprenol N-acetylglucosamine transferase
MSDMEKDLRIIMAAGGTGGHVYPAIAIADAIRTKVPDAKIDFIGTSDHMEWKAVPKAGYPIHSIWISGFQRKITFRNLLFPLKVFVSLIQTMRLFKKIKPMAVICTGGYVSGPVGYMAFRKGHPLYVQEQNSFPGVANRLLATYAKRFYTAFEEAASHIKREEVLNVGNPVRKTLKALPKSEGLKSFGFNNDRPTLLVIGGSLGAKSINQAMTKCLAELHDRLGLQIIWQTGALYIDNIRVQINEGSYSKLVLTDYLDDMPAAYSAADLVISRAGASSLSELQNLAKASILVPSPNVAGNHQYHNAKSMADAGAAILLEDNRLDSDLIATINQFFARPEKRIEMQENARKLARTDSAERIASDVLADLQFLPKNLN